MSLHVSDLRIEIGARVLLAGASFTVAAGEKVALVGPNGAGKTTLLRTLAGELAPAAGRLRCQGRLAWLAQDTRGPHRSEPGDPAALAFDHLLAASPLTALAQDLAEAAAAMAATEDEALDAAVARYGELEERYRLGDGYELEAEAERVAAGLGLDTAALLGELGSLSGGQRRRLELGRLLLGGAEVLVLDEPTNHLDAEAKAFVMTFLATTQATVVIVSHDVELMSGAIDRVLALEGGCLDAYRGTYDEFLAKRDQAEQARARDAANAARERARLARTAERFRQGNATSARRRKALERRIDRIDRSRPALPPVHRRRLGIRFPDPARSGDVALTVDGLAKRLGGRPVLEDVTFTVGRGEVFLVVGPNGAGKTTLLRCLAGVHAHDAGSVRAGSRVTVGYYAQEHEDVAPEATVLTVLREAAGPGTTTGELRGILAHFGLVGDVADQAAGTLSGGERTKLSLARLVAGRANLLLLDEPTNNLDTASREAVLGALQHFPGSVVLVSHDVEFVAQLAPRHAIVLPSGRRLPFDADLLELVADRGEVRAGAGRC